MNVATRLVLTALILALFAPAAAAGEGDEGWRTDVIFLEAMPVERAEALYRAVLQTPPGVRVAPGRGGDTLVVRDTPDRLARFRALLGELDVPGRTEHRIYVRPVLHREPAELASLAAEVFDAAGEGALTLVPDARSRRLVVQALPDTYRKLDRLLRRLDVPEDRRR